MTCVFHKHLLDFFQVFLVIVWNFELYMLPISLLVLFLKNMFASSLAYNYSKEPEADVSIGTLITLSYMGTLSRKAILLYWPKNIKDQN